MTFVQMVETDLIFTDYNQLLDVLVTKTKDCYRLVYTDNKYQFQKVVLGVNYISDHNVVPQNIKIIIFHMTILTYIPDEILYIELYQQLLEHLI